MTSKGFSTMFKTVALTGALLAAPTLTTVSLKAATAESAGTTTSGVSAASDLALAKKVRHELVMLPFVSIYDNFSFHVDAGKVTLMGQTIRPTLRSSAANVVKRLEGVTAVDNQIEVLPLSRFDDDIRIRVTRAVYSGPLFRYGMGTQPSIRIIVKNGEVTLEGVVLNEGDRNIANIRANGVFGVFKVNNNLRLEKA